MKPRFRIHWFRDSSTGKAEMQCTPLNQEAVIYIDRHKMATRIVNIYRLLTGK
jgi:hypothetical protein